MLPNRYHLRGNGEGNVTSIPEEVQPLLKSHVRRLAEFRLSYYKRRKIFPYRLMALRNLLKVLEKIRFTRCESEIEANHYFRATLYYSLPTSEGEGQLEFSGEYYEGDNAHGFRWYIGPEYISMSFDSLEDDQQALHIFNEIILLLLGVDIQAIFGSVKLEADP